VSGAQSTCVGMVSVKIETYASWTAYALARKAIKNFRRAGRETRDG
jgi:predicted amino acid dehydrogenase